MGRNYSKLQDDFSTYKTHTRIKGFGGETKKNRQEEEEEMLTVSTNQQVLKMRKRGSDRDKKA